MSEINGFTCQGLWVDEPPVCPIHGDSLSPGVTATHIDPPRGFRFGAQQGWQCPQCGACYAPMTPACFHCGPKKTETSDTSTPLPKPLKVTSGTATWSPPEGFEIIFGSVRSNE